MDSPFTTPEAFGPSPFPEGDTAALNALPEPLTGASRREADQTYQPVIARISETYRVIECRDGIQWIVQQLQGMNWRNRSFHLDRAALIRCSGATGDALAVLLALPKRYPDPVPVGVAPPEPEPDNAAVPEPLINGLFADSAELWEYQSGLFEPFELKYYDDGYPKLPACLRRTA